MSRFQTFAAKKLFEVLKAYISEDLVSFRGGSTGVEYICTSYDVLPLWYIFVLIGQHSKIE